jgi:hypothetical protein
MLRGGGKRIAPSFEGFQAVLAAPSGKRSQERGKSVGKWTVFIMGTGNKVRTGYFLREIGILML